MSPDFPTASRACAWHAPRARRRGKVLNASHTEIRIPPIGQLLNVELPSAHHLYWPELDVDIAVESLDHPERFPLVSKVRSNPPLQRTRQ
ncbi:MAG: DUF2442 domain-containing protein, partial [Woeseiaceae bacterium]